MLCALSALGQKRWEVHEGTGSAHIRTGLHGKHPFKQTRPEPLAGRERVDRHEADTDPTLAIFLRR
jgi:hypothetical protein